MHEMNMSTMPGIWETGPHVRHGMNRNKNVYHAPYSSMAATVTCDAAVILVILVMLLFLLLVLYYVPHMAVYPYHMICTPGCVPLLTILVHM